MPNYLNWGHENSDQIIARKRYESELFEAMISAKAAANAAAGSSHPKNPSDPNQTILWHEYNEETGAYTRLLFNCNFAQIIGPFATGFSDPWYPDYVVPSNLGGYVVQWINDDNGDYRYEFINSRNESVHMSEVLPQADYVNRDYYIFWYSAQIVSYYTYTTTNTLKWVILHKNEVLSYTFENAYNWSFNNDSVDGAVMISVDQYVGPSSTPTRNIYMVGNGFAEPLLINSTTVEVDYFTRVVAWDFKSTGGGTNKDTYANHFSLVEQLIATDEILQMQTFDKTGTLLFDIYDQLTNDYGLTLSDYYIQDISDFGSGRLAYTLAAIGTDFYRFVLVSKEEGVYYVSDSDIDINGQWDTWNVLPGSTRNGETFTYLLYNYSESSALGLSEGDWEYHIVDVSGNESVLSGSGRINVNNSEFINSDGSLVIQGVKTTDGIFPCVTVLKTDETVIYNILPDYEFVEFASFNRAIVHYDHVSGKTELFMVITSEAEELVVIHSDEFGNMTVSLVDAGTTGSALYVNTNDGYRDSYPPVYAYNSSTPAYWQFKRNSLTFSLIDTYIGSTDLSINRYFGSKSEYTVMYYGEPSALLIRNDERIYDFPNQYIDGVGQARITAITVGEESVYSTIYSTATGEQISPAFKFSSMGTFGQSDLRYSFYDSLTGSFRFMTYSGGYAFKYASFSYPTYNDTYWWD
jgi:hypothetical protein